MNFSTLPRRMANFIVRYGLLIVVAAVLMHFAFDTAAIKTLMTAMEAGVVMIILAELAAYVYTSINFKQSDYDPMSSLGRLIVLGAIIIACAILVGLVYFGSYFTHVVPGGQ